MWLESLGEWSWPGRGGGAAEVLPPPWVPAFPPRLEPALAMPATPQAWQPERALRLGLGMLLSALLALGAALALNGQGGLERLLGVRTGAATAEDLPASRLAASPAQPPPTLTTVSQDEAGSSIDAARYTSAALHGEGSFFVYLPRGYASTTSHYPVLYLLHGNDQPATAFLQIGLQGELDSLIAHHVIPPLIAVMIQGGRGPNNWRNRYESYVLEVQEMIDRMLPTIPARGARAIAGDSMGGYGAMNVALGNPYRFGVVESWLGFFNGLEGELRADRPILERTGLHAFLYGAESDRIADPSENAPFAAALRRAGASAGSAVYPGEHSLETLEAHLGSMLAYAGRALGRNHLHTG
ncbi:MAG TPA: alpha/beta hydrolase-fold protein [Solirubrobacteraceae bacterium]|nr:alpha/beta hydrolase-fold protein [Solirubrobacteraceae bacterium]